MTTFLSREEVEELTGSTRKAVQARVLRANGIRFTLNAADWPVVPRSAIDPAAPKAQDFESATEPNCVNALGRFPLRNRSFGDQLRPAFGLEAGDFAKHFRSAVQRLHHRAARPSASRTRRHVEHCGSGRRALR